MRHYIALASDAISKFKSFNIAHINWSMNTIVDCLAMYVARPRYFDLINKPDCNVVTLYKPHLPDNEESWQLFIDDQDLLEFLTNDSKESSKIINFDQNKYPKGLVPLEDVCSPGDAAKIPSSNNSLHKTIDKTVQVNIRIDDDPKMLHVYESCTQMEVDKFVNLFSEIF